MLSLQCQEGQWAELAQGHRDGLQAQGQSVEEEANLDDTVFAKLLHIVKQGQELQVSKSTGISRSISLG